MMRSRLPRRVFGVLFAASTLTASTLFAGTGPTSDDFDRINLDLGRWTLVNPLDVGQAAMVGAGSGNAHLALTLPAGTPHDAWGTGALRVMQASDDTDFEVEAKFNYEPTAGYNDQGIVIEQDANNWMRFDVYHDGTNLKAFIGRTVGGSNSSVQNATITPGTANYMRVRRTGNLFELELSNDGSTWTPSGSVTLALAVTQVGVYAANPVVGLDWTTEVDYFFNTASPISPEDSGPPPTDVDSPLIHSIGETLGNNEFTVEWFTDEACLGTVEYGETTSYELGSVSDAGGLYAHSILVPSLQTGITYHYRVLSDDGTNAVTASGDFEVLLDTEGPQVDVWYGLDQQFGTPGLAQPWANILGHVSDLDGIHALSYTLNGGTPVALTVGPDGRRLVNAGDFNVDLATVDLLPGLNTVVITAEDNAFNTSVRTVELDYAPSSSYSLPLSIDWDLVTEIQDVAQIIDGRFALEGIGVRTTEPGYDRLIGVGQRTWDDYEVLVPITLNSLSPSSGGAGILLRWDGHTDYPVAGTQPKSGYLPLGCIGWYRNGRIELYGNDGTILDTDSRTLTEGLTYWFKMRVSTTAGVGGLYQLKVWEDGQPEPANWEIEGQETLSDPQIGSPLLISHQYDVTFGDVLITEVVGPPNVAPVAQDDQFYVVPGGSADVAVLANDYDTDGVLLPSTIAFTLSAAHGNLSVNPTTGVVTYTHDGSPTTTDEFRYRVADNDAALSNEAVVTVDITPTPPSPFLSDDFNCGHDPAQWNFVNPLGDGTYALVGAGTGDAHLALTLPAGSPHNAWGGGGVNESARFMQDATNQDFDVVVKWNTEPAGGFNDQGIIVEADEDNWLRFDVFHTGSVLRAFIGKTASGSNTTVVSTNITVGSAGYTRVIRSGNTYDFEISADGSTWNLVGSVAQTMVVTKVGIFAANPLDALAWTAEADFFIEQDDPIVPEDGNGCFAATLELDVPDCQDDADPALGYQVAVELRIADIAGAATEFAAYVDYDLGSLSYRGDLSSYSATAYTTHLAPILQADDGLLELDGAQVAGDDADEVLATLVFDVIAECDQSGTVQFEVGGGSPSEVGYGGSPMATTLVDPGSYRFDDTAPLIAAVSNITTSSDAALGCAGAVVDFASPLATDNCGLPVVVCTPPSGSVFPVGTTTVNCVATDDCGNTALSSFDVTVGSTNRVDVTIVLADVIGPVTRCIHLATDGCASSDQQLLFTGSPATYTGEIEIPCGAALTLTAKDEQHTVCDSTSLGLSIDGTEFVAAATLVLESGDNDNDGDVDINDLTWFLFQFGSLQADGGCPFDQVTRDADYSLDGAVGSEDYVFLTTNWLLSTDCACAIPLAQGEDPLDPARARRLRARLQAAELPPHMRARLDRNGDGVFDFRDVRIIEAQNGLPPALSIRMEDAERVRRR